MFSLPRSLFEYSGEGELIGGQIFRPNIGHKSSGRSGECRVYALIDEYSLIVK